MSIKQEKTLTIVDLVASKLQTIPKSSYTVKDSDGNKAVETELKASLEEVQERLINEAADHYSKLDGEWERFFSTIMGLVFGGPNFVGLYFPSQSNYRSERPHFRSAIFVSLQIQTNLHCNARVTPIRTLVRVSTSMFLWESPRK